MRRQDSSSAPGRGGYDEGYAACEHFWAPQPGSLVRRVFSNGDPSGLLVLDAGCGDGKNALWLASRGARVAALDVSELAIRRAVAADDQGLVTWCVADAMALPVSAEVRFDVTIAYGLLHCMPDPQSIGDVLGQLQELTRPGGLQFMVAFNSRDQDLALAHPGFRPTLLSHDEYLAMYSAWRVVEATDELLHETHPHNGVPHHHSMTRVIAKKPM